MNIITNKLISSLIPTREKATYKNKLGHVLCVGGNENMGGAIILTASAALNAGAGLVTVASSPENHQALHARYPEAMFTNMYDLGLLQTMIKKADVIVLGPGLGRDDRSLEVYQCVLNHLTNDQWLIIDGDALHFFKDEISSRDLSDKNILLTPHLGEWHGLTDIEPPASDTRENRKVKDELHVEVVLKKERTEIYYKDEIWKNSAGNPSMATGGMGDTLVGIIASFIGQFDNPKNAILSAVYVHSAVADELAKTHYVTLPTKIIKHLPIFIKKLSKTNDLV